MSGVWIAINASIFGVFFLLFIHAWISLLFLSNKIKSSDYLKDFLSKYEPLDNILPYNGILDFKITSEGVCPSGYEDMNLFKWNGFIEGLSFSSKTYDKGCSFNECFSRDYPFYTKNNCRKSNNNLCCDYSLDTVNSDECINIYKDNNNFCQCPYTLLRKKEYKDNPAERVIQIIPEINNRYVNKIKNKFCIKRLKFHLSNNGTCHSSNPNNTKESESTLCFQNYCLYNTSACPNYENFLQNLQQELDVSVKRPTQNKPIFDFKFLYNSYPCSSINLKANAFKGHINEKDFIFNNGTSDDEMNSRCTNLTIQGPNIFNDIFEILKIKTSDFYSKTGIYKSILDTYQDPELSKKLNLSKYINDDLILTFKSDYDIDYNKENYLCRNNFIEKINLAVQSSNYILNSNSNSILIYINIAFVIICSGVCIYFFSRIKVLYRESNHISTFRIVLFSNIIFFIYNLTIYFFFKKDVNFLDSLDALNQYTKCFQTKNLRDFLENINNGLSIYLENYNTSIKKILVENSIVCTLLIILIIPISSFKKIMFID